MLLLTRSTAEESWRRHLHGTGQKPHEARRGCTQTEKLTFMDCPATIWMVRLLPMDASCWKKITDQ